MWKGLLPIGSVVKTKKGTKTIMIVGISQYANSDPTRIFDYCGVAYPEGYFNKDKMMLFDNDEIDKVFYMGYMDADQQYFIDRLEPIHYGLKSGELTEEDVIKMTRQMNEDSKKGGK